MVWTELLCPSNVISHSNRFAVYLLPTAMSAVIGNNTFVDGFVLPDERKLYKSLFNSLITGRSFENLSYLSSCSLSQRWRFQRIRSNLLRNIQSDVAHSVPLKTSFLQGDKLFWENLWGVVFYMGVLMIRSCHGESFTNAFFSNVNTVNLKMFPNHGGINTCR